MNGVVINENRELNSRILLITFPLSSCSFFFYEVNQTFLHFSPRAELTPQTLMAEGEIVIVPFTDPGHTFPATQLATHLASRNYQITLLLPSLPSSPLHPLIRTVQSSSLRLRPRAPPSLSGPPPAVGPRRGPPRDSALNDQLTEIITSRDPSSPPLLCVIMDVMMAGILDVCKARGVPVACLFTASASATSLVLANGSGQGLPRPPVSGQGIQPPLHSGQGPPPGSGRGGRPPGGPYGTDLIQSEDVTALLFNTSDDLEKPHIDNIAKVANKPVLAVGPLLPTQFWSVVTGSTHLIHDESVRPKHDSTHTEHDVFTWLESKPPHSVIYVSFGSVNSPDDDELAEVASGLENSNQAFIWVIQPTAMKHTPSGLPTHNSRPSSFNPNELAKRVGDRGLVIIGWAPQLMILNHKSVGGFLTHCGWNSTVEALGCGVPMLTWPIHGDQVYNARLVTEWLKTGHVLKRGGRHEAVCRNEVAEGIEKLMSDDETRKLAGDVAEKMFGEGFPSSSDKALGEFLDLIDEARRS
ncbi:hypothetical protein LUZ60_007301 [Juncus effusus]|nr:hypothetical protein LUZ60_007301 [Juncus effusus]